MIKSRNDKMKKRGGKSKWPWIFHGIQNGGESKMADFPAKSDG